MLSVFHKLFTAVRYSMVRSSLGAAGKTSRMACWSISKQNWEQNIKTTNQTYLVKQIIMMEAFTFKIRHVK